MTSHPAHISLVVTLLFGLASLTASADMVAITARQTVVRAGPDSQQAILATVPQGMTFARLETRQGWDEILLDDGREGWVAHAAAQVQDGRGFSVPPAAASKQPQTPPATIVGNDGAEMVLVPAGEFSMGSDADELDRLLKGLTNVNRELFDREIPRHQVYLDAFYIDKYEVTNAHFQQFVQVTGHRTQAEREGSGYVYTEEKWE